MWNVLISIGNGASEDTEYESEPDDPAACLAACARLRPSLATSAFVPPFILAVLFSS